MKKRLKINGIIMTLGFMVILIFPAIFLRKEELVITFWDESAEIFGVTFILLGQLFRVSARGFKAENSKEGNALVTSGPYGLVRNPMYLGIFLIGLGIVLMLFKWWVLIIFVAIFTIRYIPLMRKEEKKLTELFPETYPDYCRRVTRRFIPTLEGVFDKDIKEYLPLRLSWIYKEIGSIVAILLLTLLVEFWVDIAHSGLAAYLIEAKWLFVVILLFILILLYLNKHTKERNNETGSR